MKSYEELKQEFNKIILDTKSHIDTKNKALSSLMSQIERDYNLPLIESKLTQEQREGQIYKLYLKISNSRDFNNPYYND